MPRSPSLPAPRETFHLERFFAATEFTTPHLLAVSDCESCTVADLLALEPDARERLLGLRLGYTESAGSEELRVAAAGLYTEVEPDDVLVHATAVEVIYTTFRALLREGDRVVVQMPAYQALRSAAELAGAEVVHWWGDSARDWAPDLDELDRLLDHPRARLVVINTPHNPTGWVADDAFAEGVLDVVARRGVRLFCDEAYRGTERGSGSEPTGWPSMADRDPAVLALGLVSKGLGLPGLRTGWLVARDPEVRRRVERYKDFTSICGPAPSELLAAVALRQSHALLARSRRLLAANLDRLDAFMTRWSGWFEWRAPSGGSVTFPRLVDPDRWGGVAAFCERARSEAGVLLAPGGLFSDARADRADPRVAAVDASFRVGYGRASFAEGLDALERWLRGVESPSE